MNEIWKDAKGYEGFYQVSNLGRVKSVGHKSGIRIMKGRKLHSGYLLMDLWKDGHKSYVLVHRLVAETFIPNPFGKTTVNHKDGNKLNNSIYNLEWNTLSENIRHAFTNGLNHAVGKKKIVQKNKNGDVVKVWDSIKEAARNMNVCTSSLRACCRNSSYTIRGYKWELI